VSQHSVSRRDALTGMAAAADGPSSVATGTRFSAFEVGDQEGLDSLVRVERSFAPPRRGEVVVALRAAALHHRDLMILEGRYGERKPPDRVPLGDGAGEIVAIGEGVTGWSPGDLVTAPHFTAWLDGDYDPAIFAGDLGNTMDGWLAEYVTLPATALVRLPDALEPADAAALGAAGITAWAVLEPFAGVKPGDRVLTLGTGGVDVLALQIAKLAGATVAITSSSDRKLALASELGADITVNYRRNPDWHTAVREATGGHGVDIVVETVGLGTLPQSLACCAPNARVGLLGGLDRGGDEPPDLSPLYLGNIVLKGITSGSRRMFADLLAAFAGNAARPYVDRRFGFDEAPEALDYLKRADHVGKIVVTHSA